MKKKNMNSKSNSTKKNTHLKVLSTAMVLSMMLQDMSMVTSLAVDSVVTQSVNPTQTVTFANNFNQTQSKTITIPNLQRVVNVTTNNGNVSYSVNGENLTITVSGGNPTGQVEGTDSQLKTGSVTQNNTYFPSNYYYSDAEGYVGTLSKNGSYSSSTTQPETKTAYDYVENTTNTFPTTLPYSKDGYAGTLYKSGAVTTRSVQTGSHVEETGYYDSAYNQGCVPQWRQDECDYDVWVSTGTTTVYDYTTYYKQNYAGSVTKPGTTTYTQPYIGYASKTIMKDVYGYEVNVEYVDDITPPTPATFSPSTSSPTNQNVSLTINYPADASVKQYKIGSTGTWTTYTTPVVLSSNNTVFARSMDSAGNISDESSYAVTNIDKVAPTAPTFTQNVTTPTNGDVELTILYDKTSDPYGGGLQYKIGSTGTWQSASSGAGYNGVNWTSKITVTQNATVYARSLDSSGNISSEGSINITNIDKVAPTTPTVSADVTSPTNGNVILTASYPADSSVKEYRLNGGAWTAYSAPITMTANGTFEARAKDVAGNYSAIGTYNVTNIDKVAPADAVFSLDKTSPTNSGVNVTINFPGDAVVKGYMLESAPSTFVPYTGTFFLDHNDNIAAYSEDKAGNNRYTYFAVTNIDKVAPTTPTLSADMTAPTNGNVVVTASFPADASVKEYRLNGGAWTAYTAPVTMTANGKVEVRATDNAGNVSSIGTYNVSNIDKIAPANATLTPSTTASTNQDVNVTINYPADASVKQYKIGSTGTWTSYTAPVVISSNNTVYARSIDAVGNVSAETSLAVSNIDKTAPTTPSISADVTSPTNGNVVITASFPADASVKEYRLNSGAWTAYSAPITITANGTFEARAKDNAGNYSAVGSYTVSNIDKTIPTGNAPTVSATLVTANSYKVTVTGVQDGQSGLKHVSFPTWTETNGQDDLAPNWSTNPATIGTNLGNGTWEFLVNTTSHNNEDGLYHTHVYAFDNAGNSVMLGGVDVTVDRVAPIVPTFSASTTSPTNQDVNVTINYPADASVKQYRVNGGTWTAYSSAVVMSSNGTVEARAIDSAGNTSIVGSYSVSNIDKLAPANATFSANSVSPTNQDVSVTVSYPADASVKQYKIGSAGTWTSYTAPVVLNSNNTVYARSYDAVGNLSSESSYAVTNIDKVAPTTPTLSADVTAPTNGNVIVTASFPADASVKEYRLNGGSWTAYTAPITMTSNGKVELRATDNAGNVSAFGSYDVTNIDKTAPVNATLLASTTAPTNQNVNVTINYPADASVKQYKVGSAGTWTNYTAPVVVSANNTVYARSMDAVGNVSNETSLFISNIDKTVPITPTVSADVTVPTNGDVVVSATYPADASVKEYRLNGGTWTAYTAPVKMTANGNFEARATDNAGNVSSIASYNVTNIDKTAPANATLTASTTAPTNQNVSVTIGYPGDASEKEYKIGSTGTWTAYTAPVVLSTNNTVYARSTDAVGNVSNEASLVVSNIDKIAPTTPTLSADVTAPTNGNVVLTASFPTDASDKEYRLNGGTWTAYTAPVTMTANGKMEVRATDNAGNVSAVSAYDVTNIDKTAPSNALLTPSTTAPTNQNVNVTINYPADASVKQYKLGSTGTWTAYTAPVVVSANTTVYARSTDAVGNVSNESSLSINNIDKEAPNTPVLGADITEPTNENVVVTATFPSDASLKEYRLNGGTWNAYTAPITMMANGKVEVRATDNAGNVSAIESYDVTNIDKTAPVNATLSASTTAPTNQNVNVTIGYPADASVKQYKIGSTGTWTAYTAPVVLSSNNTVYARSIDAVGNVSAETSLAVSNIDKVAPTTPSVSADVMAPTNGNVILTASFPGDASVKEYRLNGGTWTAYTAPITMTANGSFEVRAKDVAGNYSSTESYNVTNIDKTAPAIATFVADKTSPTNSNVAVTINYPADASVKQYKIGTSGTWTNYTSPVSVTNNDTVFARSYDAVGNLSTESNYVVSNIDKVAPTTPTLSADVTAPTNGNVVVTPSFPADASVKEYRVNGGTWTAYTAPVTMTDNGKVEVRAKDVAGNYSEVGTYTVSNIDRIAPVTPTMDSDKTDPTNTNVIVTATFPADASVKEYRLNGGAWTVYTAPVTMTANGTFEARAKDLAGNYSSIGSYAVTNIDKVAPVKPTLIADKTTPTNTDVKVSVSFSADSVAKEVRVNGGAWTSYTTPVTLSANGKVEARSVDNAGNVSEIEVYEVTNIDKVKPVNSTFTADKTAPTNKDVTVSVGFPADVVKKEVRVNGGAWSVYTTSIVFKSNGTVEARGTDNAGNVSDVASYQVTNIDLVAPNAPKGTVVENENKVSLTGDADAKILYRMNDDAWKEYTGTLATEDGAYKVDFKSVDPAGNESSVGTVSVVMYRDALNTANTAVVNAETVQSQESVNAGNAKVDSLPSISSEKSDLKKRLEDVQKLIDARLAIAKALESRNEEDVKNAQEKIDLLDETNPVIIDILDDIQTDFEEADILALVAKERYDILSSRYGMSKEAYTALVNIYYAIKYTGDFMYGYAKDKVALVPETDKHYSFVQGQFEELGEDYGQLIDQRIQTDAEIKAENSVKTMESKYDPSLAVNTQKLIDAVEDEAVRASLQARLDKAKADYEASKLAKVDQEAISAVEKAESTKQTYYVSEAYKKVNALTNEALKSDLTNRLKSLEAQMALDKQVADATRTVELAEQYKYQSYIDSAQNKINALPVGDAKTSLQQRLDAVKAGLPTTDQATIIKQATNYVSLAQSLKTQYYVDKAQGYINQITDEAKKAELQAKLDAIIVK